MTVAPRVVEDARETTEIEPHRPWWGWLAAGLLLGAGLSLLFRVDTQVPPAEPTATTVVEPTTQATLGGVADQVDGFPDTLVAITRTDGRGLEMLVWPLSGELYERGVAVGSSSPPDPVAFDVSGRRIATLLPVPGKRFGVLNAGVPETAAIVALDVTGYAWHDAAPTALAYTTFVGDELFLWIARGNQTESVLVARATGIEGHVAAWGDWGFAVQDDVRDEIVLFTESGEIKDIHPGVALASHRAGWIAIEDDGLKLLSAGGGIRGLGGLELEAGVQAVRFSPDGERLAVLSGQDIFEITLETEIVVEHAIRPGAVPQIVWSTDGRFLISPARPGLVVVDTTKGEVQTLLGDRTVIGFGLRPLTNS